MSGRPPAVAPHPVAAPAGLGEILARSLEELVAAGRVDAACVLAGLACAATRGDDMRTWKRFNALLHRWSAAATEPGRPLVARGEAQGGRGEARGGEARESRPDHETETRRR